MYSNFEHNGVLDNRHLQSDSGSGGSSGGGSWPSGGAPEGGGWSGGDVTSGGGSSPSGGGPHVDPYSPQGGGVSGGNVDSSSLGDYEPGTTNLGGPYVEPIRSGPASDDDVIHPGGIHVSP